MVCAGRLITIPRTNKSNRTIPFRNPITCEILIKIWNLLFPIFYLNIQTYNKMNVEDITCLLVTESKE